MNNEDFETVRSGMAGCSGAGCMLYFIGLFLFVIAIAVLAFVLTPNPYGG